MSLRKIRNRYYWFTSDIAKCRQVCVHADQ